MNRVLITLLLLIVCLPAQAAEPAAGKEAPALAGQDLSGHTVDLGKLRGQVVLVHFWATWCILCREEMQALDGFYRAHHEGGLEIIAVSLDRYSDRDKVKKVMEPYAFSAFMADDMHPNEFDTPHAIPLTYVIDRKGIIRLAVSPDLIPLNRKNLDRDVLPLLKK
ncbi:MAG TPA: TlpA disulfide reductase family protein [Rickettsiales bacterium]|nr:TlpA disulfide reductase family protein [Rickettsiales bacterium]